MATVKISELPSGQVVGDTTADATFVVKSGAANGAAAVGVAIDTSNSLTTDGARILEVRNAGTVAGAVQRQDGAQYWTFNYLWIVGGSQTKAAATIGIDGGNLRVVMGGDCSVQFTTATGAGGANGTADVALGRGGTNLLNVTNASTGGAGIQFTEMTAPAAGAANTARLFCRDNGSGKSQLCVIFATGAIQVVATEP